MLGHRQHRSVVAYTSQMFAETTSEVPSILTSVKEVGIGGRICNRQDSRIGR